MGLSKAGAKRQTVYTFWGVVCSILSLFSLNLELCLWRLLYCSLTYSKELLCWSGIDALNTFKEGSNRASYTNTAQITPHILNQLPDKFRCLPSSPLEIKQAGRFADPSDSLLVPSTCPQEDALRGTGAPSGAPRIGMTHLRLEGSPRAFLALGSKGYELQWPCCAGTAEFVREKWSCSTKESSPAHPSCDPDLGWTGAAQLVQGDQSILLGCNPWLPVTHSNQALCSFPSVLFPLLLLIFGKAVYPGQIY